MTLCDPENREKGLGIAELCTSNPAEPWLLKIFTSEGFVLKIVANEGEFLLVALETALEALKREQDVNG